MMGCSVHVVGTYMMWFPVRKGWLYVPCDPEVGYRTRAFPHLKRQARNLHTLKRSLSGMYEVACAGTGMGSKFWGFIWAWATSTSIAHLLEIANVRRYIPNL